jgi:hypothetical protein
MQQIPQISTQVITNTQNQVPTIMNQQNSLLTQQRYVKKQ